jgi:hypothetical protein
VGILSFLVPFALDEKVGFLLFIRIMGTDVVFLNLDPVDSRFRKPKWLPKNKK